MDMKQHKYELCVLEGMQMGSRQPLRTAHSHSVGNSFDCDIYLHDISDTSYRLEILPGKLNIAVTLIDGEAVLDNKALVVGQKNKLSTGVPVRIGESLFVVESVSHANGNHANSELERARALPVESETSSNVFDDVNTGDVIVDPRAINRFLQPRLLVILIGFGIVGSGFAAWRSAPESLNNAMQNVSLEEHVKANVGGDVSVMATDDGAYMVKGWLPSRDAELKLNRALRKRSEDVVVKTSIVSDIESSVGDVFRTHGLQADISTLKPGKLVVRTQTNDLDMLVRAENAAKADVHGLEELSVVNTKPVVVAEKIISLNLENNTDKDIQLVVVGNPSYVVAGDQARYFLGSKLPTGHRIESIFKDKVVVSKNGKTTELVM